MKKIKFNWMSFLASAMLVFCSACSNGTEEVPAVEKTEVSRTAITIEKTIELTEPGTLQAKLEAAMGDEDVSTLQKLTLSGPFTGTDVQYWKTALANLIEMDLADAVPTYVEGMHTYQDSYGVEWGMYDNNIGGRCFSDMKKLEKIIFPTQLYGIGYEACARCSSLIEAVVPDNLESLDYGVFRECTSLTTVSIPKKISVIQSELFWGCSSLATIEIPSNIVFIHSYAFEGCTSLEKITIPESVIEIYHRAFANSGLTSIIIPSNVTFLHSYVFAGCKSLKTAKILANLETLESGLFENCSVLESVEVPETVTKVFNNAFGDCTSMKTIPFLGQLKEIYNDAFRNTGIESIDLSNVTYLEGSFSDNLKLKSVILSDTLTILPADCFDDCESLEEIQLPATLEVIGVEAFARTGLKNLIIPKNVHTIEREAFRETKLTTLEIPASVKSIDYETFWDIQTLEKVTLHEGLEYIGERAFGNNLVKEFNIPSTVTEIGNEAFRSTKIKMLTVPASVKKVGGSLINDCPNLTALVWNTTAELRDNWGVNRDCYLYLADGSTPYGPNWRNIIIDGVAESVVLCEGGYREDSGRSFFIPIGFKAKKVTLERNFGGWTPLGGCAGWETIVLPFTPTKIEHETKGVIAPFNSEVKGAKPFWLRSLTSEGFKDVTTFTPNVPYIIALPNNDAYLDEYRLTGKIFFNAENVDLAATPETLPVSEGPDYSLQPTYHFVQSGPQIYALNVSYWINGYENGSVFARSSSSVYAFEAYVVPNGRSARSLFEMSTRSSATRSPYTPNKTGIPQIGDM